MHYTRVNLDFYNFYNFKYITYLAISGTRILLIVKNRNQDNYLLKYIKSCFVLMKISHNLLQCLFVYFFKRALIIPK